MSSIIKIKDLEKTYISDSEKLTVLKNLNLKIEEGSKIVIVGESGSGKSTLLNILGGIDSITAGSVVAGNWDLGNLNENEIAEYRSKFLGLIFQFHYLLKDFTALENVTMPMLANGVDEDVAYARAMKLLKAANVAHRASHVPGEMSGGEQQRTAVARALANGPDILLADEPTGSLDPQHASAVFDLLLDLVRKNKMAMLFVTHDMNLAKRADRQITIENGIVK